MQFYNSSQVIRIIFKVQYSNGSVRSFSKFILITRGCAHNAKFKELLHSSISTYIQLNYEHYEELEVKDIFFSYFECDTPLSAYTKLTDYINSDFIREKIDITEVSGVKLVNNYKFLPLSMDL